MHSVWGYLKEVLLECDGKSYREFLILLGEDIKLSPEKQIFVHGLGREVFMTCFKELFQQLPVTTE
jgi:hypothetical protein